MTHSDCSRILHPLRTPVTNTELAPSGTAPSTAEDFEGHDAKMVPWCKKPSTQGPLNAFWAGGIVTNLFSAGMAKTLRVVVELQLFLGFVLVVTYSKNQQSSPVWALLFRRVPCRSMFPNPWKSNIDSRSSKRCVFLMELLIPINGKSNHHRNKNHSKNRQLWHTTSMSLVSKSRPFLLGSWRVPSTRLQCLRWMSLLHAAVLVKYHDGWKVSSPWSGELRLGFGSLKRSYLEDADHHGY